MRKAETVAGLVERLSHCAYGNAYKDGLKPAQWAALRFFARANRFSKTATAFANYQGITPAAASQTISVLVQKSLLKRTRDDKDKRKHHLDLTAAARTLLEADPLDCLVSAAYSLDQDVRATTAECLAQMLEHLTRDTGGNRFGYCGACQFLKCRRGEKGREAYRCAQAEEALKSDELDRLCMNFVERIEGNNAP